MKNSREWVTVGNPSRGQGLDRFTVLFMRRRPYATKTTRYSDGAKSTMLAPSPVDTELNDKETGRADYYCHPRLQSLRGLPSSSEVSVRSLRGLPSFLVCVSYSRKVEKRISILVDCAIELYRKIRLPNPRRDHRHISGRCQTYYGSVVVLPRTSLCLPPRIRRLTSANLLGSVVLLHLPNPLRSASGDTNIYVMTWTWTSALRNVQIKQSFRPLSCEKLQTSEQTRIYRTNPRKNLQTNLHRTKSTSRNYFRRRSLAATCLTMI